MDKVVHVGQEHGPCHQQTQVWGENGRDKSPTGVSIVIYPVRYIPEQGVQRVVSGGETMNSDNVCQTLVVVGDSRFGRAAM